MPAAKKNYVIEQRATFRKRLVYRNKLKKPVNLTGATARMKIKNGDTVIADMSTENGKIVITPLLGIIDLIIPAADTSAMNFANAVYDLVLIESDGTVTRLLEGKMTLSLGQTESVA